MKFISILILLPLAFSQNIRYLDEVFDNFEKTEDVVYGNAPDLPFIFLFEWNTFDVDLDMDIYEPEGDLETERPVIIFVHTGSFFSGHNELDDVVALAETAAKRGYVAVSMNYRLGLNILSSYSGERAVYRGVQDASAVIRYLREFNEEYKIDYDNIFLWGTSAGSFLTLHLAYGDDDERPESTYGGGLDPDLGCMDCEGNSYDHNGRPKAIVSCWGAIGDLDWIEQSNNIPARMFHGTADPVVPFDEGYPFTFDIFLPWVYGSNLINNRLNEVGIYSLFEGEVGQLHEYWGTVNGNWFDGPNEFFEQIKNEGVSFIYSQLDINNEVTVSYQHQDNWNLVGLPLDVEDNHYLTIFPDAWEGTLFSYTNTYEQAEYLETGEGYWLRFQDAGSNQITGSQFSSITVPINEGWNLITGPSLIAEIIDSENILMEGTLYGYDSGSGYYSTNELEPGKAYWVRASADGEIQIVSTGNSNPVPEYIESE